MCWSSGFLGYMVFDVGVGDGNEAYDSRYLDVWFRSIDCYGLCERSVQHDYTSRSNRQNEGLRDPKDTTSSILSPRISMIENTPVDAIDYEYIYYIPPTHES